MFALGGGPVRGRGRLGGWPSQRRQREVAGWVLAGFLLGCGRVAVESGSPVRLVFHAAPQGLDPHLHDEVATHWVLDNVYDALTAFDADMRVRPALAVAWENPDDLTWRFRLRPDVVFHDGRPLEADDVVSSLNRARQHRQSKMSGYLVEVVEVRAVDRLTIDIVTRRPYPILLNKLTFIAIVPRDAPERIVQPIGTGPYTLRSSGDGDFDLLAFERRWREGKIEPRVRVGFVEDGARRVGALLQGQADLVAELPSGLERRVAEAPGCEVRGRGGLSVTYLQMRPDAAPFTDRRVRRAVSLAIDREGLVRAMANGQGTPAGQMVSPKVFGFVPELGAPARDLAEARRLLAAAGHPAGIDAELELREDHEIGELVTQLAAAGIRLRPVTRPWSELYPRLLAGKVAFYYGTWACSSGDASDLFDNKVHSRNPAQGYGDSNSNNYSNPELDRLIEGSGATLNMSERRRILESAMRRMAADDVLIPLFIPNDLYGVRSDLAWEPRMDGRIRAFEIGHRDPG